MSKLRDKILTAVFCLFIFGIAALFFILPKQTFSENEKRNLETVPVFSIDNVLGGSFEKKAENYLSDHFPFRDNWVAANSYYQLYTGRNGANGVYKGYDGYIINTPMKADYTQLSSNLQAMLDFTEQTNLPSSLMIVPSTGYIMDDETPPLAKKYPDGKLLDYARNMTEAYIGWVDIESRFQEIKHDFNLYYKTDHHWTTMGAYNAYVEYCRNIGFEPLWDFNVETYDGFYGTTYSKSALWGENGECIEIWNYPHNVSVNIDDMEDYEDMFFYEHLDNMDKYPVFLDGNHSIERIVNHNNPDGGKLLVLKDSYAHSLVPFLIEHYSEIDMVDLRYYFESVSELTEENKYDRILYIYGLSNLCESNDVTILQ